MTDAERWARLFHDTYETLAPGYGYETRPETREFDPTSSNGRLMMAVCANVVAELLASQAAEIAALKALLREARCPQLLCADGLVPVFADPRDDTFEIQNCKWCIERDLALNGDTP